jgi:serine/threonine-protein kinase
MGKASYMVLMLALVVALPALVACLGLLARVLPTQLINLPNKRYWFAPDQRAASLEALASLGLRFGAGLAVFLCFVHWLVVRANSVQPPRLSEEWLFGGLAIFGAATLLWIFSVYRRFARAP